MKLRWFKLLYFAGIVGGFAIAFRMKELPEYAFFAWSSGHMVLLIIAACLVPKQDGAAAGVRVQTAGYLYALTGFMGAIYGMRDLSDVSRITTPLAAALFTSVLGWFVGGEIVERTPAASTDHETSTASVAAETLDHIRESINAMQEALRSFVALCDNAGEATRQMTHGHLELSKQVAASSSHLEKVTTSTVDAFAGFETRLTAVRLAFDQHFGQEFTGSIQSVSQSSMTLARNLETASRNADDTAQYLSQSRVLLTEVSAIMKSIAAARDQQAEITRQLAVGLSGVLDPLALQLQLLNRQLQASANLQDASSGRHE